MTPIPTLCLRPDLGDNAADFPRHPPTPDGFLPASTRSDERPTPNRPPQSGDRPHGQRDRVRLLHGGLSALAGPAGGRAWTGSARRMTSCWRRRPAACGKPTPWPRPGTSWQPWTGTPDEVIVWLDVDCIVHGDLSPLADIRGDVAFRMHSKFRRHHKGARFRAQSGTMVFRPTPEARQFVECWKQASERAPYGEIDQSSQVVAMAEFDRHDLRAPAADLLREPRREGQGAGRCRPARFSGRELPQGVWVAALRSAGMIGRRAA